MPEFNGLSTAFVGSHPAEAARVLEALSAADTAEFVAELAPRLTASMLRHLGPPYAARVITMLEEGKAAAVIQIMGPQAAARVVQQMPNDRQLLLLALLPVGTSIAIRLLVGYPRGTCGAYMDPWPLALGPDMAAGDALEQIRTFEGELGDCLFVSNGQRRLIGVLSLVDLVRAGPREPLSAIMRPATHTVSALASASLIAAHPGWDEFHALPVVERESRLVGALHRRALSAALAAPAERSQSNVASGVFAAYWQMVSALTEVAIGALPPVPPVAEGRRNNER
jgi:Mg/Co/Ni transporter MgtE